MSATRLSLRLILRIRVVVVVLPAALPVWIGILPAILPVLVRIPVPALSGILPRGILPVLPIAVLTPARSAVRVVSVAIAVVIAIPVAVPIVVAVVVILAITLVVTLLAARCILFLISSRKPMVVSSRGLVQAPR